MQEQLLRGVLPKKGGGGGRCSADVLLIFGGASLHGFDFNKVAKRLC